ncbi:MAG: type II CAAX endopeptidase family protein [Gloeomargarita sp. SKYBB_i_bin120]|nr:CPBP family intramembrane metalloprotease [Gloeomargarita sp. SKYG98]MCS7291445.1 CPBP family intramembrane metalloprotease [Gloeomargarita sp. SKYB120]MDW8177005.1 type II CAAX endopeptidase family protein [Gloeomargarita sp. SKYBB_i_bin120]
MTTTPRLSRWEILVAMGLTAVVLLLVARLWQFFDPLAQSPWAWRLPDLGWGVALGLGITGLSRLVYRLWPSYRACSEDYMALVLKPLVWPDLLWLALLPALSEEFLFRGVILPAVQPPWLGLVVSSAGFGLLHMGGWRQWPYGLWASLIGFALGSAVLWRENLLVAVVAHGVTNGVSAALWKWQHRTDN